VIKELTAVAYFGSMKIGVTSPQLFRGTDQQLYVVKLLGNKVGPKALANEFLAAELGSQLKLCFPVSGIISIDEVLLKRSRRLRKAGIVAGPHFACKFISNAFYADRVSLSRVVNKSEMAGVMLFDHLVHNVDRTVNRKNIIIRREATGYHMYAIDHSHLFKRGRWTVEQLSDLANDLSVNTRRTYGLLLKHFLKPEDFIPYARAIREWSDEYLAQTVAAIPEQWLAEQTERQALLQHLIHRRDLIDQITARLIGLIPAAHHKKGSPAEPVVIELHEPEPLLPVILPPQEDMAAVIEREQNVYRRYHPFRQNNGFKLYRHKVAARGDSPIEV
jgi:hypothetical protein